MQPTLYFPGVMADEPWERWIRWLKRQDDLGKKCFRELQKSAHMLLVASWQEGDEVPTQYLNNTFFGMLSLNAGSWSLFTGDNPKSKRPRLHKNFDNTVALIEQLRRQGNPRIGLMFWVQAGVDFAPQKGWILATT